MSAVKALGRSRFVRNALILTVTSLLLRTIGIFFRIYLSNQIGAEGMGLYQLVISIYVLGSTFATAGICTAVTRMITDELVCGTKKSVLHILRRAIALSILIGIVSSVIIFFASDFLSAKVLGDVRAAPALKVLTLGLPFMGVSSCLRGYFMARRQVAGSSRAQILEQFVRIGVIYFLIGKFAALGLAAACAVVMAGDTLAEIASCGYLAIGYFRDRRRLPAVSGQKKPIGRVMRHLLAIAAPITAGRYLNTALRTVENILVPDCLTRYSHSRETSLSQFGMLKGMAMPLLFFPSSFLNALSTLLIPEISEAAALHRYGRVNAAVNRTLHLTLTASILISGVFTLYARPLGLLLYDSDEVGFLLQVLAPLMPIMYLESVVDGILKGLNQQVSSLKYSVLDSVVRIAMILVLVPNRGMAGFLFVMVISNVLTSFLNLHRLLTVTHLKIQWSRWVVCPLLAVGVSAGVAMLIGRVSFISSLPLLASSVIGAFVLCGLYALLLFPLGCLSRADFRPVKPVPSGETDSGAMLAEAARSEAGIAP